MNYAYLHSITPYANRRMKLWNLSMANVWWVVDVFHGTLVLHNLLEHSIKPGSDINKMIVLASISLAQTWLGGGNQGRLDFDFISIVIYLCSSCLFSVSMCAVTDTEVGCETRVWMCVWKGEGAIFLNVSLAISFFSEPSKVCHLAITLCQASYISWGLLLFCYA